MSSSPSRTLLRATEKGFDTDNSFMLVELTRDRLLFDTISRKSQLVDSGVLMHRQPDASRAASTR